MHTLSPSRPIQHCFSALVSAAVAVSAWCATAGTMPVAPTPVVEAAAPVQIDRLPPSPSALTEEDAGELLRSIRAAASAARKGEHRGFEALASKPNRADADSAAWQQLSPIVCPTSSLGVMCYDSARDRLLLYTRAFGSDVWALPLSGNGEWVNLTNGQLGPIAQYDGALIYDPVRDRALLFGGKIDPDRGSSSFWDVWELSLSGTPTWSLLLPQGNSPYMPGQWGPTSLQLDGNPRAFYDPIRDRVVFSSWSTHDRDPVLNLSQTGVNMWTLSLGATPTWTRLTPAGALTLGRERSAVVYDSRADRLILFGGTDSSGVLRNDTYQYSFAGYTFGVRFQRDYTAGGGAISVALGDLNEDGVQDAVTANFDSNTVSVLTGGARGAFVQRVDLPGGGFPRWVALARLDADSHLDLVVLNSTGNNVFVFLGNGTGSFAAPATFAVGTNPKSMVVGDLNSDGNLDIIVSNFGGNSVTVLLGDGTGGFAPNGTFATGTAPRQVALGDLNGDNVLDLTVANSSANTISVLLGTGTGSFLARTDYAAGSTPYAIGIADVNADGKRDVLYTNSGSNSMSVRLGNGAGGLGSSVSYATGTSPIALAIADVNLDNRPDVMVANNTASTLSFLVANGIGGFFAKADFLMGTAPSFVAVGDLYPDGRPDVVTANATVPAGSVSVRINSGFWSQITTAASPAARGGAVAVFDSLPNQVVLTTGIIVNSPRTTTNDTWALNLTGTPNWTAVTTTGAPERRGSGFAVRDPIRNRLVMAGGLGSSISTNETWALALTGPKAWSPVAPTEAIPPARVFSATGYETSRSSIIQWGGTGMNGPLNDVWVYSLVDSAWTQLNPGGTPPPARDVATLVYDEPNDRMIAFGGASASGLHNDVWALSRGGPPAWSQVLPTGGPPFARGLHTALVDPAAGAMLVFGGYNAAATTSGELGDLWSLSLNGVPAWTQVTPGGPTPPARDSHTAVYDSHRKRMLVYGGYGDTGPLGDFWGLTLTPPTRWFHLVDSDSIWAHTGVYVPSQDRMVLATGEFENDVTDDIWEYSFQSPRNWLARSPHGPTPTRYRTSHYDPGSTSMILMGAGSGNSVWALGPYDPTTVSAEESKPSRLTFTAGPTPSADHVRFRYALAIAGSVQLALFDLSGRLVTKLDSGTKPAGRYDVMWSGDVQSGGRASAGIYFAQLTTTQGTLTRKIVLSR